MKTNSDKYSTMIFGILTLITALAISAVAIYYSVAGLVGDFCRRGNTYYDYGWRTRSS